MKRTIALIAFCALLVTGCNNKEEELQKQLSQVQEERTSLQQTVSDRDKYIDGVMQSVNEIYADLEKARVREGQLKQRAGGGEGPLQLANANTREKLLLDIDEIGSSLKENRKKIADLQSKLKSLKGQMSSLTTLVENLKTTLQDREQSIARLEARVQGLEVTVAEKTKVIADKDSVIDGQQKRMNTGFYIVGTRDELKKKGIITNEGGFLWGLLGSTTVMAGGVDRSNFSSLDKTKNEAIHVQGKIAEILPRRSPESFATDETQTALTIVSPDKFWQDNYLVIVVD